MSLTADRNTPRAAGEIFEHPVLTAVKIFAGSIVVLDASGWAKPGLTATGLVIAGVAQQRADNTNGESGDINVKVRAGIFQFANSADADLITKAEVGDNCYLVDDETVAKTNGSAARSVAGKIVAVDSRGVWVELGVAITIAPGGALLAANNGSDVGSKPTTRTNLGVYEKMGAPAFVIGEQGGTTINVAIQLTDSLGADLAVRGAIDAYLSDDAAGDSVVATAPSGAVAIGADGVLIDQVAKKAFRLISEADGDIDINITQATTDTFYLILIMPDGRLVPSDAIIFTTP